MARPMRVVRGQGTRAELETVCERAMSHGAQFAVPSVAQWLLPEWPEMKFVVMGTPEQIGQLEEDPDVRPYLWDLEE